MHWLILLLILFVKLIDIFQKLYKVVQNIVCNIVFIIIYSICEYCLILSTMVL